MIARLFAACTVGVLLLGSPAAWAGGELPRGVVQRVADEVIAVLANKSLAAPDKRHQVEAIVYRYMDFDTLTRLVLARNYQSFTDDQRQRFTEEFKQHLSVTYGRNVEKYGDEKVQITGDREEARGDWTVTTKIIRGSGASGEVLVDYRLRKVGETWRVIDMVIENVSLVSNFRSQFQDLLANGGADNLIAVLREKNEKGEPLKTDDRRS
jgi:phospholipid transport system substrate-binding protein